MADLCDHRIIQVLLDQPMAWLLDAAVPCNEVGYALRGRIARLKADCRTLEQRAAEAEALVLNHEGHISRLAADLREAQEALAKAREARKEQAMNPHKEPLQRIADQAGLLATKARVLSSLYDRRDDKGACSPLPRELEDATRGMQAAIVAVLRVSADYL